jgi:L-histidine Nalpha-methyltransferase
LQERFSDNRSMSSLANITIHASQFPDRVRRDLLASLRVRQANHKFHYDSIKQTQKWLALHQVYSPSRNDANCAKTYDESFERVAEEMVSPRVHLIGLGCGGGQKDARLLARLKAICSAVTYTPCDVSTAMVLVARDAALQVIGEKCCFPLVCDLASADDLPEIFDQLSPAGAKRLITFFGMIPNFEPEVVCPKLASLMRRDDELLLSGNLAPGPDYAEGMQRILPQYENEPTKDWLITFLLDMGVTSANGTLQFSIQEGNFSLKRVQAEFHFKRDCSIEIGSERFCFAAGEIFRLFFSYRYTPALLEAVLQTYNLTIKKQWITDSGEESVFLVSRR